ncbi:uncharacterized protein LOC129872839 isoform X2 [Solanum dulcamara]|uniref:uncharacterized protein LOC129872839 isoform X2 n=1 Tax=Solanum dulcamara TaxID=45834 RepID=UPI0024856568|nr:uncharacterized protein LOC129872839 isoform X2 [Solanum dulcamara]
MGLIPPSNLQINEIHCYFRDELTLSILMQVILRFQSWVMTGKRLDVPMNWFVIEGTPRKSHSHCHVLHHAADEQIRLEELRDKVILRFQSWVMTGKRLDVPMTWFVIEGTPRKSHSHCHVLHHAADEQIRLEELRDKVILRFQSWVMTGKRLDVPMTWFVIEGTPRKSHSHCHVLHHAADEQIRLEELRDKPLFFGPLLP